MTLRRLALTLALLSSPAQAGDFEDPTRVHATDADRGRRVLDDVLVHRDGLLASLVPTGARSEVPWSLVRLVLADVDGDASDFDALVEFGAHDALPVWIETAHARRHARASDSAPRHGGRALLALSELAGAAVVDTRGEAIGSVRGALVALATGRVLALALDVGAYLGTESSRTVAVPWSWLRVTERSGTALELTSAADVRWLHAAPDVELPFARED